MPRPNPRRAVLLTALVAVAALALLFGVKAWLGHRARAAQAQHGPFAVSVAAAPVQTVSWPREIHAVANLVAVEGAHLVPQLAGQVTAIYFHSGQLVQRGQPLLQLDNSNQLAQLDADRAAEKLAGLSYERSKSLYATHATSEAALQSARAAYESAKAATANIQATLAKLTVRAPFAGHIGVRQVSVGQYLSPSTEIATLDVWDPLRVQFTVPQREMGLLRVGQSVEIEVDAFAGHRFAGKVTALGSEVDPNSRNLTVEATLPNPKSLLRPGMFGAATLLVGEARSALAVPSTAITYNTFGDYVYVVQPRQAGNASTLVAVATPVKVGETRGDLAEVLSGLKAGDRVVSAGQVKLHNGAPVRIAAGGS